MSDTRVPVCRVCGQPVHPHRGSGTGWMHYPGAPVWCDGPPPDPEPDVEPVEPDPEEAAQVAAGRYEKWMDR